MAEVYWLRLPEHTDMFSEGYIGVTRNDAKSRFRGHVQSSKLNKGKNYRMTNVIKKYGKESLVVETLVICDEDYAYDLEAKLRPTTHIGWNVAIGGAKSGNYGGYKLSDETRAKMSKAKSETPLHPNSLANLKQIKGEVRGPLKTESVLKRERTRFIKQMTDKWDVWKEANVMLMVYRSGLSAYQFAKIVDIPTVTYQCMFRCFSKGWNPLEDDEWTLEFKKEAIDAPFTTQA